MTLQPDDKDDDRLLGIHTVERNRYNQVRLDGSGLIIYDTEEEDAWIQAGDAVDLSEAV